MNGRYTVGRKLNLGIVALVLSVSLLGYTSLAAISGLGHSLDTAVNSTAKKLDLVEAHPASPARAASTAAFKARLLVWKNRER